MPITIIKCERDTELYRHYGGEEKPQPVYVEIDLKNESLLADFDAEIGNGTLMSVVTGHDRRYSIPILTAEAANKLLEWLTPLAERIVADWSEEWTGEHHIVLLGEDAQAAEEEIQRLLNLIPGGGRYSDEDQGFAEEDLVAIWGTDGSTNGCEVSDFGITDETTDDRLIEIKNEITTGLASISPSKTVVTPGLGTYLRELRDGLNNEDTE